jgi:branched-chain amino acid transport system substrate-binding protein
MRLAAELAVDEINAAGGAGGRPFELVVRDDFGDPDSAVRIAEELTSGDAVAVIGHLFSAATLVAAPIYASATPAVPLLSPSASAPDVRDAGDHVFALCPTDREHASALATWVRQGLGLARGAVLYLNDPYGRGFRQQFAARFLALGGEVVESDPYLGSIPDVGPYLDRLARRGGIEFLAVGGNRAEGETVVREARRRGLAIPIVGGDGLEGIEAAGALAEGMYLTTAYLPTLETRRNQQFLEAFSTRYPDASAPNQPAAATYDAVYLLRDAVAADKATRRALLRTLAEIGRERPPLQGVTGILGFDESRQLTGVPVLIAAVREGRIEVARQP